MATGLVTLVVVLGLFASNADSRGVSSQTSSPSTAPTTEQSDFLISGDAARIKTMEFTQYQLTSFNPRQSQPGMLFYDFSATGPSGAIVNGVLGFNIKGDFLFKAGGTVALSGKGIFGYGHVENGQLSGSGAQLTGQPRPFPILAIEWNGHDLPPRKIWIEGTSPLLLVSQTVTTPK